MNITGAAECRARLKAMRKEVFKPAGRDWADEAVDIARGMVPNRDTRWSKGRLHDSIRRKTATMQKAVVAGHYTAYFVDAGVVPHSLQRRKTRPKGKIGRTVFARLARKPHPGYAARPFRAKTLREALKRKPVFDAFIDAWNKAA